MQDREWLEVEQHKVTIFGKEFVVLFDNLKYVDVSMTGEVNGRRYEIGKLESFGWCDGWGEVSTYLGTIKLQPEDDWTKMLYELNADGKWEQVI